MIEESGFKLERHDVRGARGVVLMLHGGGHKVEDSKVGPRHLGYLRMRLLHWSIKNELGRLGLSTWLVRNRYHSWYAPTADGAIPAVADTLDGLAEITARYGSVPVVLVGHSMGARAGLHVADAENVVGLIGLAPWLPPEEDLIQLRGKHLAVAVAAADSDREPVDGADPNQVRAVAARAEDVAASVSFEQIGRTNPFTTGESTSKFKSKLNEGVGIAAHGMLSANLGRWHGFVISNVIHMTDVGDAGQVSRGD